RPTVPAGVEVGPGVRTILEMNRRLTAMPCMSGDFLAMHSDYSAPLEAMAAAVRGATDHVHIEFYAQPWCDETAAFCAAAVAGAERCVAVRVLVYHLGSLPSMGFTALRSCLRHMPVEFHLMLPVNPFSGRSRRPDLRNPRKMLIVDA